MKQPFLQAGGSFRDIRRGPYRRLDEACRGRRRLTTTPTGDKAKTDRIIARPATIPRDNNVFLAGQND
jgi:hypothetical protein